MSKSTNRCLSETGEFTDSSLKTFFVKKYPVNFKPSIMLSEFSDPFKIMGGRCNNFGAHTPAACSLMALPVLGDTYRRFSVHPETAHFDKSRASGTDYGGILGYWRSGELRTCPARFLVVSDRAPR